LVPSKWQLFGTFIQKQLIRRKREKRGGLKYSVIIRSPSILSLLYHGIICLKVCCLFQSVILNLTGLNRPSPKTCSSLELGWDGLWPCCGMFPMCSHACLNFPIGRMLILRFLSWLGLLWLDQSRHHKLDVTDEQLLDEQAALRDKIHKRE
jgi:hypothetical protein